jgi:hypothetical protein
MLKSIRCFCLMIVPACLLAGCGGSPKELPIAQAAHGGSLVTLPGERGYVEILVEAAAGGGRKAQGKSQIVAYFFQPDATTAMSPGPSDVKVKLGTGEKGAVVDLSPDPKAAGKFASEPGTFPEGFNGQLDANVKGEAIQVSFSIR